MKRVISADRVYRQGATRYLFKVFIRWVKKVGKVRKQNSSYSKKLFPYVRHLLVLKR